MRITTRPITQKPLDDPINQSYLKNGMVVWSSEQGLCIVAKENNRNPFLINLVDGSFHELVITYDYFDMTNYCEITAENNYTQYFNFSH